MPINCPVLPGIECTECPSYSEGLCKYFIRYPRPVSEILTMEERLSLLEASPLTTPPIRGGEGYRGVYKRLDSLQGTILNTRTKLLEHIDKRKSKFNEYT